MDTPFSPALLVALLLFTVVSLKALYDLSNGRVGCVNLIKGLIFDWGGSFRDFSHG